MIKDISQLTNEELEFILEKIGIELKHMQPEEVPPMVIFFCENAHFCYFF